MTTIFTITALLLILVLALQKKSIMQKNINNIDDIEQQIDAKLEQRYKTFSDLIRIMNNYMDIEKSSFREVAELKQKAIEARSEGDEKTRVGDEDKISRHVEGIGYAFEQHPALKADANASDLYDKLVVEEGELAQLKLQCNDAIDRYDNVRNSFFGSMIALVFSQQLNHSYEKWRVNSDALEGRDKYHVEL